MASQAEKIYSIALAASVHSATDWTIFGASKPISLLYASAWTTRDCSRLSGAEYNIYLKLLRQGVKGLDNEHHALRARPGPRERPPESDSRLSGAAYDIYLGPLLHGPLNKFCHFITNSTAASGRQRIVDDTRRRWGARSPPKSQRQNPDLDFFIFFFHLAVLTPLSLRYGGFPANPRPQRRGGGEERTIAAPKSGFFFSHPVRLYLPAKGALHGPFSLPNVRERWGRSGIKTAKKRFFFPLWQRWSESPARWPGPPTRTSGDRFLGRAHIIGAFFFSQPGALPDSGSLPRPSQTRRSSPPTSVDPRCTKRVSTKKPALGILPARFYPKPTISRTRISLAPVNLTFVVPLILHHLPAAPPPFLDLLPPSWSALQAFLIPLGLPQRSDHSHDPERAMNNNAAYGYGLERFLDVRSVRPYAKEGPGSCYNIACVDDANIALYRAGGITGADLLARMTWKIGHSNDHERRRREYGRCDVGQTHIWVCRWEVDRRYYCERLAQLEQLCDGGEYFTFPSVRGFAQFRALMTRVLLFMNEPLTPIFYQPSPETRDIYNLIIQS
ncbi:hypothetical protein B0H13DRAFT_1896764 [Mycena leptocephala]|nr:hypothetical protein B0H13DRAFT_1896764 [Mycena leptocephala]